MLRLMVTLFLALCALTASAFPIEDGSVSDDQVIETSWEVASHPGAPPIILNGTVEQVYAKLIEINPNYDEDFKDVEPEAEPNRQPEKRKDTLHCHTGGFDAGGVAINAGIKYLRKVKGKPRLPAKKCSRVSCSWDSAIYWCNDDVVSEKTLPSFTNIAEGASVIVSGCEEEHMVQGSLDHSDHWRAVIEWADC